MADDERARTRRSNNTQAPRQRADGAGRPRKARVGERRNLAVYATNPEWAALLGTLPEDLREKYVFLRNAVNFYREVMRGRGPEGTAHVEASDTA